MQAERQAGSDIREALDGQQRRAEAPSRNVGQPALAAGNLALDAVAVPLGQADDAALGVALGEQPVLGLILCLRHIADLQLGEDLRINAESLREAVQLIDAGGMLIQNRY
jgi:hypothetical protein